MKTFTRSLKNRSCRSAVSSDSMNSWTTCSLLIRPSLSRCPHRSFVDTSGSSEDGFLSPSKFSVETTPIFPPRECSSALHISVRLA